jgi:hypothetical protein
MKQAWDSIRNSEQLKHRSPSRRRWSPELAQRAEIYAHRHWEKSAGSAKKEPKKNLSVTERESAEVAKLLQLQSENFIRTLELQSLRNSVSELLNARSQSREAFRQLQGEIKGLECVAHPGPAEPLDYELSERDWLDIIER